MLGNKLVFAKDQDARRLTRVDFKHLKRITVKWNFPMLRSDEILDRLHD